MNEIEAEIRRQMLDERDRALDAHFKRVRRRAKRVGTRYSERTHRLRIALKKLRYAAEFFAPLYPRRKAAAYIKKLKTLLDRFGEANDVHEIGDMLARLGDAPELCFAAGVVAGWHGAREKRLTNKALKSWRAFRKVKPFWT